MNEIEILAPVGSIDALYAAIENGANAVYLGGKLFNARQYASNFDNQQIKEAVEYAHTRDARVYVTVNILLDDNELKEAIDYIICLYNMDVDAVIVQDIGLVRIVKEILPDFEIHASTQMTINNYFGVKFLEDLDFQRVVLARELSVNDIKCIYDNTKLELEGFIHGALCICYSGQCLMSSIIGGRSGNRGRCAQPCRMPYSIVDTSKDGAIGEGYSQKYLLSPMDLNTIDYLDKIADSGISSLKIEGRMKRPEYVAVIVSTYKKALDNVLLGKSKKAITDKDKKDILQIFNRGFTKGFIMEEYGRKYISYDKPNNRGMYLGSVVKLDGKYIHISLEEGISKGDGIEIRGGYNRSEGLALNKIFKNNTLVNRAEKGDVIVIPRIREVCLHDKVYKTSDVDLLKKAEKSYKDRENKVKFPIYMAIDVSIGRQIKLHLWDNKNYITVESESPAEKARKLPLTIEKIKEQMSKLGNTPYMLENIEINLEDGAMTPLSVLNDLRRKAVLQLTRKRQNFNNRVRVNRVDIDNKIRKTLEYSPEAYEASYDKGVNYANKVSISVNNNLQFKQLNLSKLDRIYLPLIDDLGNLIKEVKKYDKEVYISIDRIVSNEKFKEIKDTINKLDLNLLDGISVSNLGALKFIKDNYKVNIHGDIGLNIFNTSSVKLLSDYGLKSYTLSPELTMEQIEGICTNKVAESEALVYGYLPLMVMKHCPLSLVKKCDKDYNCEECSLAEGYGLKDRKDMVFSLIRKGQTTTLYNSQPLVAIEHLNELYSKGVDILKLDFTIESERILEIQEIHYNYAKGTVKKEEVKNFINKYKLLLKNGITKGHYFRGVL